MNRAIIGVTCLTFAACTAEDAARAVSDEPAPEVFADQNIDSIGESPTIQRAEAPLIEERYKAVVDSEPRDIEFEHWLETAVVAKLGADITQSEGVSQPYKAGTTKLSELRCSLGACYLVYHHIDETATLSFHPDVFRKVTSQGEEFGEACFVHPDPHKGFTTFAICNRGDANLPEIDQEP